MGRSSDNIVVPKENLYQTSAARDKNSECKDLSKQMIDAKRHLHKGFVLKGLKMKKSYSFVDLGPGHVKGTTLSQGRSVKNIVRKVNNLIDVNSSTN